MIHIVLVTILTFLLMFRICNTKEWEKLTEKLSVKTYNFTVFTLIVILAALLAMIDALAQLLLITCVTKVFISQLY
jgi:hypothetical protein